MGNPAEGGRNKTLNRTGELKIATPPSKRANYFRYLQQDYRVVWHSTLQYKERHINIQMFLKKLNPHLLVAYPSSHACCTLDGWMDGSTVHIVQRFKDEYRRLTD